MEIKEIKVSTSQLNLGRLHWYLLIANQKMDEKRFVQHPAGELHEIVYTDFGKEIENDEINWWVFKREDDIPSLFNRTKVALAAAQTLKDATKRLNSSIYQTTTKLFTSYDKFSRDFGEEIAILLDYAKWLHQKNILAPTIIFNYRTWGSTRMSDRIINVDLDDINNIGKLEELTRIVLGFKRRGYMSTYNRVKSEMDYEKYEALFNPNDQESEINVNPEEIAIRFAYEATHDFAEYFEQLRDSLRNVMLDIEQHQTEDRVLTSDNFWRTFITKSSRSQKTEQLYWDFKKTLDMWHISENNEKNKKAQKFSELVAGFANNKGGVIIVGVTDKIPREIVGLIGTTSEVERRVKYAHSVIGNFISYDQDFVRFHQVIVPNNKGDSKLCLVIIIQQTRFVLGVKGADGISYKYPIREETGLTWKDQPSIHTLKIGIKSDNYDFINVLQQYVNEEI